MRKSSPIISPAALRPTAYNPNKEGVTPPGRGLKHMSYLIYLRKSRKDDDSGKQSEAEVLARHEKALLDLAKSKNLPVGDIYREVRSGDSIDERPYMQQLLDEVRRGKWDGVLVMEVERLARGDTIDQGTVAKAFKMSNTQIITPIKTYDPTNEYDEEYFEFGLFMSRREYKTINRRLQRGRHASVNDGKYIAADPPFGYDKVRIPKDTGYTLKPNNEAPYVQQIYAWYIKGDGCAVIAKKLDDLHVPTRKGGIWSKATVRDILRNPTYAGKIRWAYKIEHELPDGSREIVINDDPILVDGLHEPLVSEDEFEKVQLIMEGNRRPPVKGDATLKNPLAGLGYCKLCGSTLTRLGPNKHCLYPTLKCSNRYCNNVSVPLSMVEEDVIAKLIESVNNYVIRMEAPKAPETDHTGLLCKAIKDIDSDLAKAEKQLQAAYDYFEQGIYDKDTFLARSRTIADRKETLLADQKKLEAELAAGSSKQEEKQRIPEIRKLLDGYWQLENAEDRNKLLKGVLARFDYLKTEPNRRGSRDRRNYQIDVYPKLPG